MGYRSDVVVILPEHVYRKLLDKIAVISDYDTKQEVYMLLNEAKILQHDETHDVLIIWLDIKWYNEDQDYKDIAFIDEFLHSLPDKDYLFLRTGEDIDDNEVFGDYYYPFDAYIEHNIHIDTDRCTEISI